MSCLSLEIYNLVIYFSTLSSSISPCPQHRPPALSNTTNCLYYPFSSYMSEIDVYHLYVCFSTPQLDYKLLVSGSHALCGSI